MKLNVHNENENDHFCPFIQNKSEISRWASSNFEKLS